MACEKCEYIGDEIGCQGCWDEIKKACEEGKCEADEWMANGSLNGHKIRPTPSLKVVKKE